MIKSLFRRGIITVVSPKKIQIRCSGSQVSKSFQRAMSTPTTPTVGQSSQTPTVPTQSQANNPSPSPSGSAGGFNKWAGNQVSPTISSGVAHATGTPTTSQTSTGTATSHKPLQPDPYKSIKSAKIPEAPVVKPKPQITFGVTKEYIVDNPTTLAHNKYGWGTDISIDGKKLNHKILSVGTSAPHTRGFYKAAPYSYAYHKKIADSSKGETNLTGNPKDQYASKADLMHEQDLLDGAPYGEHLKESGGIDSVCELLTSHGEQLDRIETEFNKNGKLSSTSVGNSKANLSADEDIAIYGDPYADVD